MPLGDTNQNSTRFPHYVIQILIQDPLCTEPAQCLHEVSENLFYFVFLG